MSATQHGPSFLRWAGSKRQSLPKLRAALPQRYNRYVEPFAGSAALFFAEKPSQALLGDLNGLLVNALIWVRDEPRKVVESLSVMPRDRVAYYQYRQELNRAPGDDLSSAVLFIYVNRNCFNGLWRTNKLGQFNVPFGGDQIGNYPPASLFDSCSKALSSAQIVHQDFQATIAECGDGDLIFADPPYFTATERTFVEYGQRSFGASDLQNLISALRSARDRGAGVVLTYSASMEIEGIPEDWSQHRFDVTRNVGGFKDSRRSFGETLYASIPSELHA